MEFQIPLPGEAVLSWVNLAIHKFMLKSIVLITFKTLIKGVTGKADISTDKWDSEWGRGVESGRH